MSVSGKIIQSIAANKLDEETINQICKESSTQQIYEAFKTDVWPTIKETLDAGQIESKVVAMQVLEKLLTRLLLDVPQSEASEGFGFDVELARLIADKMIAKVSDLYCCTLSVSILLDCFVCGGQASVEPHKGVVMTLAKTFAFSALVSLFSALSALGAEYIIIQSTTSTQNSGLLSAILPKFEAHSGIKARVVAVGTGQALRNAQNGDGDVLFVHARAAEEAFVKDGWGLQRFDVMYNDFVIVGPAEDPAKVLDMQNVTTALSQIAHTKALFVSRGDDSGTHKAEKRLWTETEVDTAVASGTWYRETGSGMGATLNMAATMEAYTLTDRASWLSFGNESKGFFV